jgi:2-oxo-4-hydroxy-4-carboxy-5-ureidoimidazoline decarboxylase
MTESSTDLAAFDAMAAETAIELLRPACASSFWSRVLVAGRPYGSVAQLQAASDGIIQALGWSEVEEALAAHPRIGDRAAGSSPESAWSRQEQSGTASAAEEVAERLRAGNVAYEERFGHVFLICATGRSADDLLGALTERLGNDAETEQPVVRRELAAIVRLRLARLVH